jgi:hypothetical protein
MYFLHPYVHLPNKYVVLSIYRKFCGIILQFQLLEKILEGTDMDSSEMHVTDAFAANEDLG